MFRSAPSVCVLVAAIAITASQGRAQTQRITMEAAVQIALSNHPDIRMAAADAGIARGNLRTARSFVNPDFGFSIGPARSSDTSLTTFELGVGQVIEMGGKRGARSSAATARLRAAESILNRQSQFVALNARRAFSLVLIAEQRATTTVEADSIGAALLRYAEERLELTVGTALDVNVAAAAQARDKRQRLLAEQRLTEAQLEFRIAIGVPVSSNVVPEGALLLPVMPGQSEDDLVAAALSRRPDLAAAAEDKSAAEADRRYARALAWPDPMLGFSVGRDDFRSRMFSVGFQMPLWNNGAGDRIAASAGLDRARTLETAAQKNVEREVRAAYRGLTRALDAARSFERDVVARLGANLDLARESFENGKISLIEYNLVRRDLIAARLEYFDALADVLERRYELAAAAGGAWE